MLTGHPEGKVTLEKFSFHLAQFQFHQVKMNLFPSFHSTSHQLSLQQTSAINSNYQPLNFTFTSFFWFFCDILPHH